MIIGIGSDLCDVRRIEKTLSRFGQRFVDRVFTDVEQRNGTAGQSGPRLTRSVSRRRKPARRRWEPAFPAACS